MQLKLAPFTMVLVTINVIVTVCMLFPIMANYIPVAGGFIPARLLGTNDIAGTVGIIPAVMTPFTAPFIHSGLLDMLFPSLMLILMGSMNEKILGWRGVCALFFGGASISAIIIGVFLPNSQTIFSGSHDAVSSVIAAYLILYPVGKPKPWGILTADQARPLQLILLWLIINLVTGNVFSYEGFVSTVIAPVAAFTTGIFLARPLLLWKYRHA